MSYQFFPRWRTDGAAILSALRTVYSYTDREPDRATGWLFSARQIGALPPTEWASPLAGLGDQMIGELEKTTGVRFEAACFQAYLDGSGCGWHHDRDWDEQAVLSLGVTRKFGLRRNGGDEEFLDMKEGDLLFMPSGFQQEWEHGVPAEDIAGERCSIVFRAV